jgi:DNA mismatch repair protein MutS
VKHLHDEVGAKTLFATHYHELTDLEHKLPHLRNIHVGATEENGKLIFLHKIMPGPADQSYGIHVAELAGLPHKVLREATVMLRRLEAQGAGSLDPASKQLDLFQAEQTSAADPVETDVINELKSLYLADKTPLQVMDIVHDWQEELKKQ